jgi:enoyl-CoA hydratase/carnithine racemase
MGYKTVIYEKKDRIALLTLNRPGQRNSINLELIREFMEILDVVERNSEVRVLIITGSSDCFSSGADLKAVTKDTDIFMRQIRMLINRVENLQKPTIAAVSGWCLAGGLELAMACDLRIVSKESRIGDQHILIGLVGGAGATTWLPKHVGIAKAKELIFTGDRIDGEEAYRIGLANHVYPADEYLEGAMQLARKIATMPPRVLHMAKEAIHVGTHLGHVQSMQFGNMCSDWLLATPEFEQVVRSFVRK